MLRRSRGGSRGGGSGFTPFAPARSSSSGFVPSGDVEADLARLQTQKLVNAVKRGEIPGGSPEKEAEQEADALIKRLLLSPDEKAQQEGIRLQAALGVGGAAAALQADQANSITAKALKAGAPVIEFISRPSNMTQEAIQAGVQATGADKLFSGEWRLNEDEKATELSSTRQANEAGAEEKKDLSPEAAALLGEGSAGSGGFRDVIRAAKGEARWDPTSLTYTKNLSYQNALGSDDSFNTGALGKVTDVANFTGTAAVDPLNFISGGSAGAVRKTAAEGAETLLRTGAKELTPALARELGQETVEGLSKEAVQQAIQKVGIRKGLTPTQLDDVTRGLQPSADVALKGDRLPRRAVRALTGKGTRTGEERVAEDIVTQALKFDRGGARIAGRSLTPEAVRAPVRAAVRGERREIGDTLARQALNEGQQRLVLKAEEKAAKKLAKADEFIAEADRVAVEGNPEDAVKLFSKAKGEQTKAAKDLAKAAELAGETDVQALMDAGAGNILTPTALVTERRILPRTTGKIQKGAAGMFRTRSEVRASKSLPVGTDKIVETAKTQGQGAAGQARRQAERVLNAAVRDTDAITPELIEGTRRALDVGGDIDEYIKTLPAEQIPYAQGMKELRNSTYDTQVAKRLADPSKLRVREDYMPRYVTKEAAEALEKAVRLYPEDVTFSSFSTARQQAGQGGRLLRRKFMKDSTLEEVDAVVSQKLIDAGLLPEGSHALELDPAVILPRRFNDMLPALQLKEQVTRMEDSVRGTMGEKLVKIVHPGEKDLPNLARRGFKKIPLGEDANLGAIYAHPDLAPEITDYVRMTTNPDAVGEFGKFMDGWNRLWKSYATVPLLTGTGFHVKNSIGNTFNNYLAGVNTAAYKEALELQANIWKAKRLHPDLSVPDALRAMKVPDDSVRKAELALENSVLEEGFFNTDLSQHAELATQGKRSKGQRALAKIDIRNPNEMFGVPTGRKVGEHIEDNARLAHFISKLDETGSAVDAATSVRKYLFDYGDLTPFERKVMKRAHAFYTFTRKNTPLQFAELARNPSKFTRANLAKNMILGNGEEDGNAPDFMSEIGTPLGKSQSSFLSGTGNPVVGNIETPFDAAMKTADPLLFLAGKRSGQEAMQGVAGNFSGGPAEVAKIIGDYASGSSSFTGADLKSQDGNYKINPLVRLSTAVAPNISKGLRLLGSDSAGPPGDSARLRVIKALTGIQAKELTPEMREIAASQKVRTVQDVIDALKKAGVAVPTESELEQLGLLEED